MKGRKGHKRPVLLVHANSIQKWEKCPDCEQVKLRGEPWKRACTGPRKPAEHYLGE